ncbi:MULTISPECIES: sulfur carrier protein ThiS [Acetobacter]|uniref:Sulfur carrier protein ThiS n=1 Tax=Acetobacter thailandicus TaxID=1502842 RepID=A0ABT3QFN6_9PROT|nr:MULTISPECIES: sulfur carrier protein ThiS [Acetobacter]MBS0959549.1 sulfur carrier protein ThiS [Acetobacter thailandicus]MBS0980001.1 sulfur carrier protein ThiS [Acetobacter thailandicus]MBS0985296.1 sulfur carrier protein ThiS [Acetobacter thailandicus]MBS1002680.1 sulfur carrier protein ThiS [Acetobacter thailandicus]MCX2564098.1 sulfur carrier protein ThiS [Acetobacter thailandicus]
MKIMVNDEAHDVRATTLAALVEELGYGGARIATALNGGFIPLARRGETALHEGARIEIVAPMQGG